ATKIRPRAGHPCDKRRQSTGRAVADGGENGRDSKAARRLESSCRTRARGDLSQGGCAVAKARGKRLGTPDAAGAVERMRVARKAGRRNVLSIIQEVQTADPS